MDLEMLVDPVPGGHRSYIKMIETLAELCQVLGLEPPLCPLRRILPEEHIQDLVIYAGVFRLKHGKEVKVHHDINLVHLPHLLVETGLQPHNQVVHLFLDLCLLGFLVLAQSLRHA